MPRYGRGSTDGRRHPLTVSGGLSASQPCWGGDFLAPAVPSVPGPLVPEVEVGGVPLEDGILGPSEVCGFLGAGAAAMMLPHVTGGQPSRLSPGFAIDLGLTGRGDRSISPVRAGIRRRDVSCRRHWQHRSACGWISLGGRSHQLNNAHRRIGDDFHERVVGDGAPQTVEGLHF